MIWSSTLKDFSKNVSNFHQTKIDFFEIFVLNPKINTTIFVKVDSALSIKVSEIDFNLTFKDNAPSVEK